MPGAPVEEDKETSNTEGTDVPNEVFLPEGDSVDRGATLGTPAQSTSTPGNTLRRSTRKRKSTVSEETEPERRTPARQAKKQRPQKSKTDRTSESAQDNLNAPPTTESVILKEIGEMKGMMQGMEAVSYTHLTLPTILRV